MKKVYIGELLPNVRIVPLLYANFDIKKGRLGLFAKELLRDLKNEKIVDVVGGPEDADYLLIPHNFRKYRNNKKYIQHFIDISKDLDKKILIFADGDKQVKVDVPNSVIFSSSCYRSDKQDNEIVIPTYAEDLGMLYGVEMREKAESNKPIIGFCGWAGFSNSKQSFKTRIKDILVVIKSILSGKKNIAVRKNGVFMREKILAILSKTPEIVTNFIIRTSFSSSEDTIELDPQRAREQYVSVLKKSDIALSVRGDGNYSIRFYEILSLGRIPLLIDTDAPLPLEKYIPYNDFVIRVPLSDVNNIGKYIERFWDSITNEEFIVMQKKAREAFETYLKFDTFLIFVLDNLEEVLESNKKSKQ